MVNMSIPKPFNFLSDMSQRLHPTLNATSDFLKDPELMQITLN